MGIFLVPVVGANSNGKSRFAAEISNRPRYRWPSCNAIYETIRNSRPDPVVMRTCPLSLERRSESSARSSSARFDETGVLPCNEPSDGHDVGVIGRTHTAKDNDETAP